MAEDREASRLPNRLSSSTKGAIAVLAVGVAASAILLGAHMGILSPIPVVIADVGADLVLVGHKVKRRAEPSRTG